MQKKKWKKFIKSLMNILCKLGMTGNIVNLKNNWEGTYKENSSYVPRNGERLNTLALR
jgi:hypothetical protein